MGAPHESGSWPAGVPNYNKYNNTLESITYESYSCYLSELIKVIYGYRYEFIF